MPYGVVLNSKHSNSIECVNIEVWEPRGAVVAVSGQTAVLGVTVATGGGVVSRKCWNVIMGWNWIYRTH